MNWCLVGIFFLIGIGFTCKKNFRKTFQRLFGRKPRRFCDQLEFSIIQVFTHFLEFLKICPIMFPFFFFAKMIDIRLLTQKNQTLQRVFGWNIALRQKVWVGKGRFLSKWTAARARVACALRPGRSVRSPYSWITMRRSLRKRRVFDFVPSYLK